MNQEQKQIIFNCLLMLKGQLSNEVIKVENNEILNMLENEVGSTMESFWNLVDENTKLKERIKLLEY